MQEYPKDVSADCYLENNASIYFPTVGANQNFARCKKCGRACGVAIHEQERFPICDKDGNQVEGPDRNPYPPTK